MKACHLVCGPPASGKTQFARRLVAEIGACLIDSDEIAGRLVRAGMELAGLDPDDRDSPVYKAAFRQVVYETMYDMARTNIQVVPVVMAGPFTREGGEAAWIDELEARLGTRPTAHFIWCDPETRRRRIVERGEARDRTKLEAWEKYVESCREERPVWPHHFVDTSSL